MGHPHRRVPHPTSASCRRHEWDLLWLSLRLLESDLLPESELDPFLRDAVIAPLKIDMILLRLSTQTHSFE